jgi:hypothetical protein
MRLAGLLRLTAIGIALLCWTDPPVIVVPNPPVIVDAAVIQSPRDGRPARNGETATIADARADSLQRLADELGSAGTLDVHEIAAGDSVPCDANQPCVVVTDGAAAALAPDRKGPISIVRVGEALTPNVEATVLSAPAAHLAGQATAPVSLNGAGVASQTSRVRLFDGSAVVGEATHKWTADGEAIVHVPWWPVAPGARTLVARVTTDGLDERTDLDDAVASRVMVEEARWPVVTVERRASWSASFLRRAIETDARFAVSTLTDLAPRVSVATAGPASLDDLDAARVVVVGAPDTLTVRDVDRLEAFVRQRGGAVVLLPDRAITGPAARLVQHRWHERLEAVPSGAGPLRASEWLLVPEVGPLDLVWARSSQGAVVVATPTGAGMVLISGALDAWRHRAADGAFDGFWRATIARLAAAVGPPLAVEVSDPANGGDDTVRLQARTMRDLPGWQVTATRTCGDGPATTVRMWPADEAGAFRGRVPAGTHGDCRIDARVDRIGEASATLEQVTNGGSSPRWTQAEMAAIASTSGGVLIDDGDVSPLVQGWLQAQSGESRPERRYPMRSWWWLLPFVASLAGEWWLRRRTGLR